jgi:hypothetical protein
MDMDLKLGNKLPRNIGSNLLVSVLLEGWLHRGCGMNNHCLKIGMRKARYIIFLFCGTRGSVVVKALCYKPEGRGFKPR